MSQRRLCRFQGFGPHFADAELWKLRLTDRSDPGRENGPCSKRLATSRVLLASSCPHFPRNSLNSSSALPSPVTIGCLRQPSQSGLEHLSVSGTTHHCCMITLVHAPVTEPWPWHPFIRHPTEDRLNYIEAGRGERSQET